MLEQFIAEDPNNLFSRYALALEIEKEGRDPEAIGHLQEAISRDPNFVAAYYHFGRMLARTGQVEEARAVYQRGLEAAGAAGDQRTCSEIQEALNLLE